MSAGNNYQSVNQSINQFIQSKAVWH